ncbi:MAG: Protease synthase and sporulation negative regulatory protein PAI 1 [Betaproteobacteria bacterium ADurb.Bin341]|nr:MAG: Protease synthase and sporulation negative regulatory protein PAI 1 [Betaproteobacteria bacterium ADurb.Bin341]
MNDTITFRPLAAADFAAVTKLARIIWQATYKHIITQAQIDHMLAERYSEHRLSDYLSRPDHWFELALVDGEICGFCACEVYQGEYKLDKLYIHPARQRLGIGGMLIGRAAARGRELGYGEMILAVNKRNEQAIAAYQKHGFAVRESVCVDIGKGFVMDDFIMEKPL